MTTVIERVALVAENEGLKISQLERALGASKGVFSRALKNKTDIQSKWLVILVENYPHYNAQWLLTGKGNMLLISTGFKNEGDIIHSPHQNGGKHPISPSEYKMGNKVYKLKTDYVLDNQEIPLYDIEATAGIVALFNSQKEAVIIDTIRIPNLPKCDGAVFVTGDSMYPLLKSGDIVAYKEIYDKVNSIFWGEMYLISLDVEGEEYISVKYIQKSDKGDHFVKLVSQNQHHQPKDVHIDKIGALAMVKASIRINAMG